ncbi:putative bifunctional diguanylate cyclase/phosphodiesterase [Croceibacterium aestuarii]|uniref:putative bifunctional diguanylate cyclase/phosphodiesterase n=1 Tax=Croceibacterium aestuarii TaxID=3064139 RepID=UPI00272ED4B8|nr:bifunctional diguanylate cyclase/phosphodiesterase [Croceibacterium sp. D39]
MTKHDLSLRWLVIGSAVMLSAIVAALIGYLGRYGAFATPESVRALTIASITYCVAAALLVRIGLAGISELERLGLTDSLSGVPNRRALHLDVARNAGEEDEVALALVDLDGFKAINDQYGHFVGDTLIKRCSELLREMCGGEGRTYRLGGDEFAVVVIGPIAGNILESTCRRLLQRLAQPVEIDDRKITIGASIGMARRSGDEGITSSELLRRADVAMYASKSGGKMRCTWFIEDFDRSREEVRKIEEDLRRALGRQEFHMVYQPLVDATDGSIVAVEALLRWDRGSREPLGPNIFIPIAEETGLINQIGRWVLRQACKDAMAWDLIKLSVNVSPAQLRNPEFPVQLGQILEETGFPPERLELEITETYLVGDPHVAGRALDMIRGFGVGVALDDFGTGYASIGFLRKFRFEKLKLDRSLIVGAADDDSSRAMMISSIAVARAMNMGVTAEGVETDAQATLARAAGCDQMQGWLYYKAVSADEVTRLLNLAHAVGDERHGYVANA